MRSLPLLQSLFARKGTHRGELLKLWKWLNYLQEDTLKMFTSLKGVGREQEKRKKVDLADLIRDELRIMGDITDFRWSFLHENGAVKIPAAQVPALRRFLGEAALNAWKHSGVREGVIRLSSKKKEIR